MTEEEEFQGYRKYLEAGLKEISEGRLNFYSLQKVEEKLEKRINKQEDDL
jgi:hypothetical protein